MGWSCAVAASQVLGTIRSEVGNVTDMDNVWTKNGRYFSFEIGNTEHVDGSITGSVSELTDVNGNRFKTTDIMNEFRMGNVYSIKRGTFKIAGNGSVIRFPHMTKAMKDAANNEARIQQEFAKGSMFVG